MKLIDENELPRSFLKISFAIGFILHLLSIIIRAFIIQNGPKLLLGLIPYMIMEIFFLYASSMTIYISQAPLGRPWMQLFSMVNVLSFMTLIGLLLTSDAVFGENLEETNLSTIKSLMKLLCITLLSGPLISNTSFLGFCCISKLPKGCFDLVQIQDCSSPSLKQKCIRNHELLSDSTEYATNLSSL
ncbi:unnamed protein product [Moneuplotes crassus]|uniref:Uncharacterized protein n=1 Tax=Euplotes crassus TaxID=5936 RepID=A0AAD1XZ23_EUPCR|nr:unnamed protein product [Moneuplotes crassus]